MNYWQRKVKNNLKNFIKEDISSIYIVPNKKGKLYKRKDGRLISHRAVVKTIKRLMKDKLKGEIVK